MSHTHLIGARVLPQNPATCLYWHRSTRVPACAGAYTHTHAATGSHTHTCAHTLYGKQSDNSSDHLTGTLKDGFIQQQSGISGTGTSSRQSHRGANEMAEAHSSEAEGGKPVSPVSARNAQRPGNWPGQTEKLDGFVRCLRGSSSRNLAKNKDHSTTFPDERMASNSSFFFLESILFICAF